MPLGRPTDDGEIVPSSRHYRGGSGNLGKLAQWNCPRCGVVNDAPRRPEEGCLHCGAGDPTLSKAGGGPSSVQTTDGRTDRQTPTSHPVVSAGMGPVGEPARQSFVAGTRILRLLEYVIHPGEDATEVLRRSLVGQMRFPWGTITGTIVDSSDPRQEDLLRLARMQPGVWMGNPGVNEHPLLECLQATQRLPEIPFLTGLSRVGAAPAITDVARTPMTTPDVGPPFTIEDANTAQLLLKLGGPRLCYTLALGLQAVLPELASEPERFLTEEEALRLASALMACLPKDWQGDAPEDPGLPDQPPAPGTDARLAEIQERMRQASQPAPVYREVKP